MRTFRAVVGTVAGMLAGVALALAGAWSAVVGAAFGVRAYQWDNQPAVVRNLAEPANFWPRAFVFLALGILALYCAGTIFAHLGKRKRPAPPPPYPPQYPPPQYPPPPYPPPYLPPPPRR